MGKGIGFTNVSDPYVASELTIEHNLAVVYSQKENAYYAADDETADVFDTVLTVNGITFDRSADEREICIVSNNERIIKTYLDEIPWYAYSGECDTTGSMIWYVEGDAFENLTVLREYEVDPNERWADLS